MKSKIILSFSLIIVSIISLWIYNLKAENNSPSTAQATIANYDNEIPEKEDPIETITPEQSTKESSKSTLPSETKDGVTVEISNVDQENGNTIVEVAINNHIYNIADMEVDKLSTLDNKNPTDYEIIATKMGGHHVDSKLTFEGELSGPLVIALNEYLIFNFNI